MYQEYEQKYTNIKKKKSHQNKMQFILFILIQNKKIEKQEKKKIKKLNEGALKQQINGIRKIDTKHQQKKRG